MIVCIAGYNNRVATLCEHAQELLLYDFLESGPHLTARLAAPSGGPTLWTDLLQQQGVRLLICGGLCRHTQRLLLSANIEVTPWICGSVDAVLDAFSRDSLAECLMPGAEQRMHGRGFCGNHPPEGRMRSCRSRSKEKEE